MKRNIAILACAALAAAANSQISTIGPFTGDLSEGWETTPTGQFTTSYIAFGGPHEIRAVTGGQGLHVTTGWSFFSTVFPHGGQRFLGGAGVNGGYFFTTPATRFGGYFCTNADAPDATAIFYDANGNQFATAPVTVPTGNNWTWNGWQSTIPFSRVDIIASNQWGGFVMQDDLEVSFGGGGGTTTINPSSMTLTPGIVVSGNLNSLFNSDDNYLVLRPGIVFSTQQDPIVMTLSGTAPGNTPSMLQFVWESKANQGNIRETVRAFNFMTNSYDQLNQVVLTTGDVMRSANLSSPSNYIGPNNEVRAQMVYRTVGPVFSFPWLVSIDEATWRYTQ